MVYRRDIGRRHRREHPPRDAGTAVVPSDCPCTKISSATRIDTGVALLILLERLSAARVTLPHSGAIHRV